jgi:hypothetical protein
MRRPDLLLQRIASSLRRIIGAGTAEGGLRAPIPHAFNSKRPVPVPVPARGTRSARLRSFE